MRTDAGQRSSVPDVAHVIAGGPAVAGKPRVGFRFAESSRGTGHDLHDTIAEGLGQRVKTGVGIVVILQVEVLDVGQDEPSPGGHIVGDDRGGDGVFGNMKVVHGQRQLLEIVRARGSPRRLAGGLHGRQQQGHQNTDNGDYYQ